MPNLSLERLTTLCQKIYFPTEEFTIATFITVHVCLLNLFRELTQVEIQDLNLSVGEREAIFGVCLKNAETAVRNLRLYMPPTFDNIEALMLGVRMFSFPFCNRLLKVSRLPWEWILPKQHWRGPSSMPH